MVRTLVTVMFVACGDGSPEPAAEPVARTTPPADTQTHVPNHAPSDAPTDASDTPTTAPTDASTTAPTDASTTAPTDASTTAPTDAPTDASTADATTSTRPTTEPRPSPTKPARPVRLDIADLGTPGEAIALAPVRGKITIFDFWAAWCKPCKVLEPALVAIARAHPHRVAIRRIDVVDSDSAVYAQHLAPKGYGLPHIRVMDDSGRTLLERSSDDLDALIAAIRAAVERTPTP
ncbi:MAG: thioredoxin domain-containing protein [Kofleriaceae bacterium]